MAFLQDKSGHTCRHCETEVLTIKGCTLSRDLLPQWWGGTEEYSRIKEPRWTRPLHHSPQSVREGARSGCVLFASILQRLKDWSEEDVDQSELFLVLEATKLEQTPVDDSESPDGYLPDPAHDRSTQETYEIIGCDIVARTPGELHWKRLCFLALSDWDDPSANHALVRSVDGHTSSKQAIEQIGRRLQYCLAHHNRCKTAFSGIRPRRFLSVGDSTNPMVKVIRAENRGGRDSEPYVALSYCWGQDQVFKLASGNKNDAEDGVSLNLLPKTIIDAIHVTRELGIKLLWVDSLCLVQDEEKGLAEEIAKMHHYYGNAYITISAASAESCTEGFLQDQPISRSPGAVAIIPWVPFYLPVDLGVPGKPSYLKLCPRIGENDSINEWPVINSRAWTLQEGLLSHRLVSFGSRVVKWSCRTDTFGEYWLENENWDDLHQLQHEFVGVCNEMRPVSERGLALKKLRAWYHVVNNYTDRSLSNARDKLPAISGIASILSAPSTDGPKQRYQLDFLAGLLVHYPLSDPPSLADSSGPEIKYHPQDHFESWLLAMQITAWKHEGRVGSRPWFWRQRRQIRKSQPTVSPYIAPSWSWASHPGAVGVFSTIFDEIFESSEEVFDGLGLKAWEQGLRVHEVCVAPSVFEAPLGALDGGSLTLDGKIFRPEEEQVSIQCVDFDDGRTNVAPGDCKGYFCLQIVPKGHQWDKSRWEWGGKYGLHGIVLEPVELGGRFPSEVKVYRRVGVYYVLCVEVYKAHWYDDEETEIYKDCGIYEEKELSGTIETITII